MSEERTEKPTPKRRKQNRKEGQVARTPELGAWSGMLLLGISLPTVLGHELRTLRDLMADCLTASGRADPAVAFEMLGRGLTHVLWALLLLGSALMLVGTAGALAQGGFFLATGAVKPKLSKLDPIKGARRLFGLQALWQGVKTLVKSVVVAGVVWSAAKGLTPLLGGLLPIPVVLDAVSRDATAMVRDVAIAGLVMAAADYAVQRRRIGKQTRMTKNEVKQEHKQSEGDPLVKSAIRSRQLAAARNRMMADIPTADVVLVNPTHVAVALAYEPERGAPRVVARGAGVIAAAIRERATEARVPLVRDVPLARALYTSTRVGQTIPPELFAAVAQVLAFVISRRRHGQHGGRHDSPRSEEAVPDLPRAPAGRHRRNSSAGTASGR